MIRFLEARQRLGPGTVLEFNGELVVSMQCPDCAQEEFIFKSMARLYENAADCPNCGGHRDMNLTHRISGTETFLDRTLAQIDVVRPLAAAQFRAQFHTLPSVPHHQHNPPHDRPRISYPLFFCQKNMMIRKNL